MSKVPSRRLERGEGPQAPVLLPSEQVVNLPGHRSRQAPPAAAGAQTRRACFRGFNPQVSGLSSAVAESPAAGAAHVAAASRTPPPPRQRSPPPGSFPRGAEGGSAARPLDGLDPRTPRPRSPSLTVSPTRAPASPAGSHLRVPPLRGGGRRIPWRVWCGAPDRPLTTLMVGPAPEGRRCAHGEGLGFPGSDGRRLSPALRSLSA